jgi:hypothetical protein
MPMARWISAKPPSNWRWRSIHIPRAPDTVLPEIRDETRARSIQHAQLRVAARGTEHVGREAAWG